MRNAPGPERSIAERKFFPGYVLVKMDLGRRSSWHLVKNTPKVDRFPGQPAGRPSPDLPAPRRNASMHQVQEGVERPKPSVTFEDRRDKCKVCRRALQQLVQRSWSRKSTRSARGSRWRCPSSGGRPRSNWSTPRWRSSSDRVFCGPGADGLPGAETNVREVVAMAATRDPEPDGIVPVKG